ncbi:isocitrate/isopropylmalate dehydrogenase family protein [Methanopyrus sp.]
MAYKIAVIPGDGIGPEVIEAALHVIEPLIDAEFVEGEAGDECTEKHGDPLPEDTLELCREADAVLFGAAGETAADVIVRLRQELDLYANIRPVRGFPGLRELTGKPYVRDDVDFVIVRENTEGLYSGIEGRFRDTAYTLRIITEEGTRRIAEVACDLAEERGSNVVTCVHKANVMRETCGIFREVCKEVVESRGLEFEEYYVDAAAMFMITEPERFNVIVTSNMFGDILSDEASALVGGLGLAPSGNVGDRYGLFEPVHGSAPDIAGKGIANPFATILSAAMMLEWLGEDEAAEAVREAVGEAIREGVVTPDLGGDKKTMEVAEFVREAALNLVQ